MTFISRQFRNNIVPSLMLSTSLLYFFLFFLATQPT